MAPSLSITQKIGLASGGLLIAVLALEALLQLGAFAVRQTGRDRPGDWLTSNVRVLALGDSNTFGIRLDEDQAYPSRLEALWNADVGEPRIEVVNLGYPSTNSSGLLVNAERMLDAFAPHVVLVQVGANDFWTAPVTHPPSDGPAVIGADGVFSSVAGAAGITAPKSVPIVQAEVALPSDWDPSVTKVWFDTDETRFFFWLVPESPHKGVVGLIGDGGEKTRESLKRFLALHNLEPEAYQAAQVALYTPRLRPWTQIGGIPVSLVGDAAGHVKVTTVGGSVSGFLGAQAAATALLNGRPYSAHLLPVKRELNIHWLLRLLLDRLDNRGYDTLVSTVTLEVRHFLSQYDRDSMDPVVWRLPILEPRLLKVLWSCLRGKSYSRSSPISRRTSEA